MKISYTFSKSQAMNWKLYSFTTENIKGYISKFVLEDKKVLTVAGSGDHILNSVLGGAKDITAFDINLPALYFSELKIIAVLHFSFDTFLDFFMIDGNSPLEYKQFCQIKDKLSTNCCEFFEKIYSEFNYNGKELRTSQYFNNKYDTRERKLNYNCYLDAGNFQLLKEKLKKANITFCCSSLENLSFMLQNYKMFDIIFLSNISDYFGKDLGLKEFLSCVLKLKNDSNILVFGYVYDIDAIVKRSQIDYKENRLNAFSNTKYKYEELIFESAIEGKKDCVLILKEQNYGK